MTNGPTTRCKFQCTEVAHRIGNQAHVKLSAVYPDKNTDGYEHGEDHAFFNATPFANLEMTIQNPYGAELFQAGDSFYVDFTKVPKPVAA